MGKTRRQRQKFHLSASNKITPESEPEANPEILHPSPLLRFNDDLFKGINITVDNLATDIDDDRKSVKSFKSLKSELTDNSHKILPKKSKLKLRRELFLRKMGIYGNRSDQLISTNTKSDLPERGNLLNDALPSLESLLYTSNSSKKKLTNQSVKHKGVEKAKKRKKEMIKEVKMYKKLLSNKQFKANSMTAIAEHIKAVCQ